MTAASRTPFDAEAAAQAVLAGQFLGVPKATGQVSESLRQLRATRRSAIKASTQAANLVQGLLVTAPADLRGSIEASLYPTGPFMAPGLLDARDPGLGQRHGARSHRAAALGPENAGRGQVR